MSTGRPKILVVEPDEPSRRSLVELLGSEGYEVTAAPFLEECFKAVEAAGAHLLLLSSDVTESRCTSTVSDIKGSPATAGTRVLLLTRGQGAERARGLDLGADDALSVPWTPEELLARVRTQLRERSRLEALELQSRVAEEGRDIAQTAFQALAVTEKMTRDAFSLGRVLKIGVAALFAVAVLIAGIFVLFSRRAEKETRRAYSVIARLEHGVMTQEKLLVETRRARSDLSQSDRALEREQLQKQSEELRQKISDAQAGEVTTLRKQLDETTGRLKRIETESATAEGVIRSYAPSVCLIHVSVGFSDRGSGRRLRYGGTAPDNTPLKDSDGNVVYTLEGNAPEVRADFFGTGFIVADGEILTNHHVAQPWWKNDELSATLEQNLTPEIATMTAYFPEVPRGFPLSIARISDQADLSLLKGDLSGLKRASLHLDNSKGAAVSGQPLISLGYATGLGAILARAGDEAVNEIVRVTDGEPRRIMEELARRKLVRPLVTQGHIGDVLPDKIVYDAQTTSGGSGGPLINRDGQVIGVTFAVVKGFGGSNFGVPIGFAQPLLKP